MRNTIQAYIPQSKREGKASIRGLWYSNKQGVCYDYLHKADVTLEQLPFIKKHYKQEAIFYRAKGKAVIWHNTRKQDILQRQDYFGYTGKQGLKAYLKDILKRYGGLTIYIRQEQNYLIEVWA